MMMMRRALSCGSLLSQPHVRFLGQYSRMLDLGGHNSPDSKSSLSVDVGQNSTVRAVLFDFDSLSHSVGTEKGSSENVMTLSSPLPTTVPSRPQPDMNMVQQVASLLHVSLGNNEETRRKQNNNDDDDDDNNDIRSKYADKLALKQATVTQLDLQKQEETRGDAAGHFAARRHVENSNSNWLAATGTGGLLRYLSQRSIRVGLVASTKDKDDDKMQALQNQLESVIHFALIVRGDNDNNNNNSKTDDDYCADICRQAMEQLDDLHPSTLLLVSDRDSYIRTAKDMGWFTCRLLLSQRRGNVSAHHTVTALPDVRQVVDTMNGISFSTVLKEG